MRAIRWAVAWAVAFIADVVLEGGRVKA